MKLLLDVGGTFGMNTANVFDGCGFSVHSPERSNVHHLVNNAALVCFGGGADIHPSLYGDADVASMVGHEPSERDLFEMRVFQAALKAGVPMFGICRGAQFLCAMSGGKLIQDVSNHGGTHPIILDDGKMLPMTSTHHQMMYPWEVQHELLAWTPNRSKEYVHGIPDYVHHNVDPEVVFFPGTNSLAVQGHPEWMDPKSETVQHVREWARHFLNLNYR